MEGIEPAGVTARVAPGCTVQQEGISRGFEAKARAADAISIGKTIHAGLDIPDREGKAVGRAAEGPAVFTGCVRCRERETSCSGRTVDGKAARPAATGIDPAIREGGACRIDGHALV